MSLSLTEDQERIADTIGTLRHIEELVKTNPDLAIAKINALTEFITPRPINSPLRVRTLLKAQEVYFMQRAKSFVLPNSITSFDEILSGNILGEDNEPTSRES